MKTMRAILLTNLLLVALSAWGGDRIQNSIAELSIGGHPVYAEIADTRQKQQRGLMERTQMCAECGMLFVFEMAGKYDFWMKNTPLPLAIAFIAADGTVINVEEMQPNTTDKHHARGETLYALEMHGGWFAREGIRPGDKVLGLQRFAKIR